MNHFNFVSDKQISIKVFEKKILHIMYIFKIEKGYLLIHDYIVNFLVLGK